MTQTQLMTQSEIFDKVCDVLIDALIVDREEVGREKRIIGDLGAESIDFLDIAFRIERNFPIKVPRDDFFHPNIVRDSEFVDQKTGWITPAGRTRLQQRMPYVAWDRFADNADLTVSDLYTVDMLCQYIEGKLAA